MPGIRETNWHHLAHVPSHTHRAGDSDGIRKKKHLCFFFCITSWRAEERFRVSCHCRHGAPRIPLFQPAILVLWQWRHFLKKSLHFK